MLTLPNLLNASIKEDPPSGNPPADLSGVRVLIAEDNKLNAFLLRSHMQDLGCLVTTVGNGQELMEIVHRDIPDIIILDCRMPVMNGVDTIIALKKDPALRNIPIIVATGDLFRENIARILSAGANAYIEKPIDIDCLQKMIGQYLLKS